GLTGSDQSRGIVADSDQAEFTKFVSNEKRLAADQCRWPGGVIEDGLQFKRRGLGRSGLGWDGESGRLKGSFRLRRWLCDGNSGSLRRRYIGRCWLCRC